jgi:Domain of unknown function (DUF4062)
MWCTLERRYQVFVSSTYTDLVDERREVIQALLELDCIPAGMELFPAANDEQWLLITKMIDDCDYYLVVVGGRYGSISKNGISYTEREYGYALERGMPILGFLHDDPGGIPLVKSERDAEAIAKLDDFRAKVRRKPVRTYRTPDELGAVVSRSLIKLIKSNPAEGWVRGRFAATPEMNEELSRLRARAAEEDLRRAATEAQESKLLEQFAQGADSVALRYTLKERHPISSPQVDERGVWHTTWDEVFSVAGPVMMDEASEGTIKNAITERIYGQLAAEGRIPTTRERLGCWLDSESFGTVKVQFRALGLIEKGVRKRYARDDSIYWKLTERGDSYLVSVAARKRTDTNTTPLATGDLAQFETVESDQE